VASNSRKHSQSHLAASTGGVILKRPLPIVKWAGGKTQLLPAFHPYIPQRFNRYYEPFVGGGAMFFHMYSQKPALTAVLSDLNQELINCYSVVRDQVNDLIVCLKKHRNEKEYFYSVRAQDTSKLDDIERAARLLYLNKTCFNGLYRVNSRGQFNVPFGSYKNPRTCDETNLLAVSAALKNVSLLTEHFNKSLSGAKRGDFVYLDPPYQPLSATANFTSYTSKCFGEKDQEELAETVRDLDRRGCKFMLSNSDNEFVRALYTGFRIESVLAARAINCRGDKRGKITELLVMNY
jgi:DNA adenine methylase